MWHHQALQDEGMHPNTLKWLYPWIQVFFSEVDVSILLFHVLIFLQFQNETKLNST